jgi:hypothetical protein
MTAGPFKGQFIYGDVGRGGIYRAFLEKVKGEWQGAVFCMSGGLEVGVQRVRTGADGEIYVGGLGNGGHSNQGWNGTTFGLQRLTPKAGANVFEIKAVRSRAGGMELEFTKPVSAGAGDKARYSVNQWRYTPTSSYGGNKVDNQGKTISNVQVSPDKKSVFLQIDGLKTGQVTFIQTNGVTAEGGDTLWYKKTWYTLNQISESQPFEVPTEIKVAPIPALQTRLKVERLDGALRAEWPGQSGFSVELTNLNGAVVATASAVDGLALVPVQGLRGGLYVLRAKGAGAAGLKSRPVFL